jgi:DNA-binding winged helix-turn-helix (wHTH) protein
VKLRFDEYVLDSGSRQLLYRGREVPLSPKALQLLQALLEARPRALSKSELRLLLWPDTAVADANLSNLVGEIRTVLKDDARAPRFVRTVQRFGYGFRAEAPAEAMSRADRRLSVRLRWPGGAAELGPGEHTIGRDPEAAVCLVSASVSRRHARVHVSAGGATLEDLASKNGTFLNGTRVKSERTLADGDEMRAGSVRIVVRLWQRLASTETGVSRPGDD